MDVHSLGKLGLVITIDDKHFFATNPARCGQIERGSGLADSSLEITYSYYFSHILLIFGEDKKIKR